MKVWKTCLIAQMMVLVCDRIAVSGQSINFLAENARTIDDLYYVLGPNFKLFVAAYWRYLMASCPVARTKMTRDVESGVMERYCNFLTECPVQATTQSCIVQVSADAILKACCTGPRQGPDNVTTPTPTPTPRTTASSIYIPTSFDPVAQAACLYGRVFPSEKIIGGSPSFKGEFPWIAMLLRNGGFLCSCIIADATHVLTAAHCFDTHRDFYVYEVIAGKFRLNLTESEISEQRIRVTSFVTHEFYNSFLMSNDIAILELASPFQWTDYIQPACFPSPEAQLEEYCTVAGWGYTNLSVSRMSLDLMKVDLQAYTKDECYDTFRNTIEGNIDTLLHDGSICAANSLLGGKDACKGDSGSPLMCVQSTQVAAAYYVYGIVSNGNECALPGEPGFYTNVQYYLSWIQETINSMS